LERFSHGSSEIRHYSVLLSQLPRLIGIRCAAECGSHTKFWIESTLEIGKLSVNRLLLRQVIA
ncbi:hypothetical protein T12_16507, partial [Trichinella patagoniensis]